jgi:dynein heavy chain 1
MVCHSWLSRIRQKALDKSFNESAYIYNKVVDCYEPLFQKDDLVDQVLHLAEDVSHVMEFSFSRIVSTFISYLNSCINALESHENHFQTDSRIPNNILEAYLIKKLVMGLIICTVGDAENSQKCKIIDFIKSCQMIRFPPDDILQYEVSLSTGDWIPYLDRLEKSNTVLADSQHQDMIIRTTDTLYYENLIFSFLEERKPILLCGPPGCGKSMMILSCLRSLPDVSFTVINFSSTSNPCMLRKTLVDLCNYKKTAHGMSIIPKFSQRLVGNYYVLTSVFCDEINLPDYDQFGTQRIISFMRQLIEYNGFWDTTKNTWVNLENIQFLGAW